MKKVISSAILVFLFLINTARAQLWYGDIDSLKLLPANPTAFDSVKVVAYSTFPSGACMILTDSVVVVDSTVTVYAVHFHGGYAVICHSVDTISLGLFIPGNYKIYYHLEDTIPLFIDIDTLSFTISEPIGITEYNQADPVSVYPNPSSNTTMISIDKSISVSNGFIILYNALGNQVIKEKISNNSTTISIGNLPKGIYFYKIVNGSQVISKGKMIVQF